MTHTIRHVLIAQAGVHGKRRLPIGILEEIIDMHDLEQHAIPILHGDHDGRRCGLVIALDLVDDLLFGDLEITDDAMDDIRSGELVHVSIAHERDPDGLQRLQHVALVRKDIPPGMNLPALQSYIDTNVDLDEKETITMTRNMRGDELRYGSIRSYTFRPAQWQPDHGGQFTERRPQSASLTVQRAGEELLRQAQRYAYEHPECGMSIVQALERVRALPENQGLCHRYDSTARPEIIRSYGQHQKQAQDIESQRAAGKEVDLRARKLMAKSEGLTYVSAVSAVLAGDVGLRKQYAGGGR